MSEADTDLTREVKARVIDVRPVQIVDLDVPLEGDPLPQATIYFAGGLAWMILPTVWEGGLSLECVAFANGHLVPSREALLTLAVGDAPM